MIPNRPYSVMRAERLTSENDRSVYLFIRDIHNYVDQLFKVLLPRKFTEAVTDFDIYQINNDLIWLTVTFKGLNRKGSAILEIT
jgi:hypothetical protein